MLAGYSGLKGGSEGRKRRRKLTAINCLPFECTFLAFFFFFYNYVIELEYLEGIKLGLKR